MNIKPFFFWIILLGLLFLNTSCCTIFHKSTVKQTITIQSDPPGAYVWVDDGGMFVGFDGHEKCLGRTPLSATLDPWSQQNLSFYKEGYHPVYKHITQVESMPSFFVLCDALLFFPFLVDIMVYGLGFDSSKYYYPHNSYTEILVPLTASAPANVLKGVSYEQQPWRLDPSLPRVSTNSQYIQDQQKQAALQLLLNQQQMQNQSIPQFVQQPNVPMSQPLVQQPQMTQQNNSIQSSQPSVRMSQPCYCGNGKCRVCSGSGIQPGSTLGKYGSTKCHTCHGTGICVVCHGTGKR